MKGGRLRTETEAYHIEGLSIREISRRYKHSRRLVRKALEHPIPEKYHLWQAKKAKVLRQYRQRILDLEENRPPLAFALAAPG